MAFVGAGGNRVQRLGFAVRPDSSRTRRSRVEGWVQGTPPSHVHLDLGLGLADAMPVIGAAESVSAIVVDAGASSIRIGWAGEDAPRCILPNEYGYLADPIEAATTSCARPADEAMDVDGSEGNEVNGTSDPKQERSQHFRSKLHAEQRRRFVGEAGANTYRPGMEIGTSFGPDGLLSSATSFLAQIEYGISTFLDADPSQHPIIFTEPTGNTKEAREELIELAFEGLGVPGFYIANQPVMSSYVSFPTPPVFLLTE